MTDAQKKNKELVERFPFLRPRYHGSCTSKQEEYSFTELDQMPPGWRTAFSEDLCRELKEQLVKENRLEEYSVIQIKEKYGSLRWYATPSSQEVEDIVHKYEQISTRVCIECGKPATQITKGYISPYCDDCVPKDKKGQPVATAPISQQAQ